MSTGLRENSTNLFTCQCTGKAFAIGVDPESLQVFALLCLQCGTDYIVKSLDTDDSDIHRNVELTKVVH